MAEYILAYSGGRPPESPEEGQAQQQRWKQWVADLGDAMVNPGSPMGPCQSVSADGVTEGGVLSQLMGFSVVKADSIEAAIDMAKACPFTEMGTVEVAELMQMPG